MTTTTLSILNLQVPLGYFTEFHDDGFVDSIEHHYRALTQRYHCFPADSPPEEAEEIKEAIGMCQIWRPWMKKYIHIYYLDRGRKLVNTQVRGHEETHALCRLGKLSQLELALEREHQVRLPLHKLRKNYGEEVVAELGGIYAWVERKLRKLPEEQEGPKGQQLSYISNDLLQAIKLYNEASPIWEVELGYRVKERRA